MDASMRLISRGALQQITQGNAPHGCIVQALDVHPLPNYMCTDLTGVFVRLNDGTNIMTLQVDENVWPIADKIEKYQLIQVIAIRPGRKCPIITSMQLLSERSQVMLGNPLPIRNEDFEHLYRAVEQEVMMSIGNANAIHTQPPKYRMLETFRKALAAQQPAKQQSQPSDFQHRFPSASSSSSSSLLFPVRSSVSSPPPSRPFAPQPQPFSSFSSFFSVTSSAYAPYPLSYPVSPPTPEVSRALIFDTISRPSSSRRSPPRPASPPRHLYPLSSFTSSRLRSPPPAAPAPAPAPSAMSRFDFSLPSSTPRLSSSNPYHPFNPLPSSYNGNPPALSAQKVFSPPRASFSAPSPIISSSSIIRSDPQINQPPKPKPSPPKSMVRSEPFISSSIISAHLPPAPPAPAPQPQYQQPRPPPQQQHHHQQQQHHQQQHHQQQHHQQQHHHHQQQQQPQQQHHQQHSQQQNVPRPSSTQYDFAPPPVPSQYQSYPPQNDPYLVRSSSASSSSAAAVSSQQSRPSQLSQLPQPSYSSSSRPSSHVRMPDRAPPPPPPPSQQQQYQPQPQLQYRTPFSTPYSSSSSATPSSFSQALSAIKNSSSSSASASAPKAAGFRSPPASFRSPPRQQPNQNGNAGNSLESVVHFISSFGRLQTNDGVLNPTVVAEQYLTFHEDLVSFVNQVSHPSIFVMTYDQFVDKLSTQRRSTPLPTVVQQAIDSSNQIALQGASESQKTAANAWAEVRAESEVWFLQFCTKTLLSSPRQFLENYKLHPVGQSVQRFLRSLEEWLRKNAAHFEGGNLEPLLKIIKSTRLLSDGIVN